MKILMRLASLQVSSLYQNDELSLITNMIDNVTVMMIYYCMYLGLQIKFQVNELSGADYNIILAENKSVRI